MATVGVKGLNAAARQLLVKVCGTISQSSGDDSEGSFLFYAVLVERFNAVLLHDSLPVPSRLHGPTISTHLVVFKVFKSPRKYIYHYRWSVTVIIILQLRV